jgi:metallo-beta-lactamase class B
MPSISLLLAPLALAAAGTAPDRYPLLPPSPRYETADNWRQPVRAFRIADHSWYVGTAGISALLIDTPRGAILIDGGLAQAADTVLARARDAGVEASEIRWLLLTHAHADHAGIAANAESATMLARGGTDDIHFGDDIPFPPAQADRLLQDGETIELGGMRFVAHFTPGHTPGSTSWTWTDTQHGKPVRIAYVDSLSAPGYKLVDNPRYPGIVQAYEASFATVAALPCDLLITPHPDASGWTPEATRAPHPRPMNCAAYAQAARERFDAEVAKQRAARRR